MLETTEINTRSPLQVALGFLLGIPVCVGSLFASIFFVAVFRLPQPWMFPVLNAILLIASGTVALRKIHRSSYPEGVLIAVSVAFLLNVILAAATLSRYVE
jgi:hypothetical protein